MFKKGLLALFAAVSLCGVSHASAPIISNLPDIIISEQEDNYLGSDNNFFVFTNAFKFDDFVNDDSTTESGLLWSFDEGDPAGSPWFNVNGKAPIHVGTTQMGSDGSSYAAHVSPANEIRQGSNGYATFRDVIYTPGTRTLPPGFSEPTADHSAGKIVQFYVSDGTTVTASNLIQVKTINNVTSQFDAISGGSKFKPLRQSWYGDKFREFSGSYVGPATTAPNTAGWYYSGQSTSSALGPGVDKDWDAATQALRIRIFSSSLSGGQMVRFRAGGWYAAATSGSDIPYASVNPTASDDNVVRGKFYVFATGQATPNTKNQIPEFEMRVGQGYAIVQSLDISTHLNGLATVSTANPPVSSGGNGLSYTEDQRYAELAPSFNPALPSMYRVDYHPVKVSNNTHAAEPITRSIQSTCFDNEQDNGYICLAESVLGVYPASLIADGAGTLMHTYNSTEVSAAHAEKAAYNVKHLSTVEGSMLGAVTSGETLPTVSDTASGLTFNSTAVTATAGPYNASTINTYRIAVMTAYFLNGDTYKNSILTQLPKVSPNKQYKVRFHLTSTVASNTQSDTWLYSRTNGYSYINILEIAGSHIGIPADDAYAAALLPGTGNLTGGNLELLIVSPLNLGIRPEYTNLAQAMPSLYYSWGPGTNAEGSRNLYFGLVGLDSPNVDGGNYPGASGEQVQFSCDTASVYEFNMVQD